MVEVDGLWLGLNPAPLKAALGVNVVVYHGAGMGVWLNWREFTVPEGEAFVNAFD